MSNTSKGWGAVLEDNSGGKEISYAKLEGGSNVLRILDADPISFFRHWVTTANGGKGQSINCIGSKNGCPLCAKRNQEKKDKVEKETVGMSLSFIVNVYNHKTGKVEILEKGKSIFQMLYEIMLEYGNLSDYDVNIKKSGSGRDTTYMVLPVMKSTPIPKDLELFNRDDVTKCLTKEQIITLMNGGTYEDIFGSKDEVAIDDGMAKSEIATTSDDVDVPNFAD